MKKNCYTAFVAGKSGGHLLPCIAKAQQIIAQQPETKIIFFTSQHALDITIVKQYPFLHQAIFLPIQPFPHKRFWRYPAFMWYLFQSFFMSLFVLYRFKPTSLTSMGGLISLPVCIAAKILAIPVIIYELNVVPGKAIQALTLLTDLIFICFKETQNYFKKQCTLTEYPLRFNHKSKLTKKDACNKLGFNMEVPTLLIMGGSQGSLFLNNLVKKWVHDHQKKEFQIIHQIGNRNTSEWQNFYKSLNIPARVFSFHHELEDFYAAADLIVCRAGAGTLFEILFFQKKALVIPLETTSNNHQLFNAQACAQEHPKLITVIRQQDLQQHDALFASYLQQQFTMLANS